MLSHQPWIQTIIGYQSFRTYKCYRKRWTQIAQGYRSAVTMLVDLL